MRPSVAPAAALALALSACASSRPPTRAEPFRYRGYFATYPTGLRLVALQTAEVGRATVLISYGIGAADDPPGKEGLARLAVALTGRSVGRGGFTIGERYFAAGALEEAKTGLDEVSFRAVARLPQLGEALAVEAHRMREPLAGVTDEEFQAVRETLASRLELESSSQDGEAAERAEVVRRAFAGTRYARAPATPSSVRAITLDDARRWAAAYLVPARAVLVVTGPEAPEEVSRRVLTTFGPLAATGAPDEPRVPPISHGGALPAPPAGPVSVDEKLGRPGASARVWLTWLLPGEGEGGTASAAATASLLEMRLRERAGKLHGAVAGLEVRREARLDASALIVRVDLRLAATASVVRDALVAAAPSDDVLADQGGEYTARSLRQGIGAGTFWRMEDGNFSYAAWLVRATGRGDPVAELRSQASAQVGPPLVAYYREHVRPERARRVVVTATDPVPEQPQAPVATTRWVSRASVLEAASPGPDRVLALVEPPGVAGATRHRLSNGMEVRVLRRGSLPVVDARLMVDADLPEGPAASVIPLLSLTLSRKEWTLWGDFGCHASPFIDYGEKFSFVERGPTARLDAMLERLACWTQREVSTDHLDEALATIRREGRLEATPGYRSVSALLRAAYRDPRRALPTGQEVGAASARDAKRWLDAQLRPERALLVLVGNVEPTPELIDALEERFGDWRPGRSSPRPPAVRSPWPTARRVVLEDFPGAKVGVVGIALRVPTGRAADDAALRALRHLVALRVTEQVIGLEGGSANADLGGLSGEPLLRIWITVRTDQVGEALKRTLATLERIARAPPRDAEAWMARWVTARDEAYRFDTVDGAGNALQEAFFRGEPLESWDALPASLAGVDAARLHAAARSTSIGREAIAVMGDAASLGPALEAAGLAPEVLPASPPRDR